MNRSHDQLQQDRLALDDEKERARKDRISYRWIAVFVLAALLPVYRYSKYEHGFITAFEAITLAVATIMIVRRYFRTD